MFIVECILIIVSCVELYINQYFCMVFKPFLLIKTIIAYDI